MSKSTPPQTRHISKQEGIRACCAVERLIFILTLVVCQFMT